MEQAAVVKVLSRPAVGSLNNLRAGNHEEVSRIENKAINLLRDVILLEYEDRRRGERQRGERQFWRRRLRLRYCSMVHLVCIPLSLVFAVAAAVELGVIHSVWVDILYVYAAVIVVVKSVQGVARVRWGRGFMIFGRILCWLWVGALAGVSAYFSAYCSMKYKYSPTHVAACAYILYATLFLLIGLDAKIGFSAVEICSAWLLGILVVGISGQNTADASAPTPQGEAAPTPESDAGHFFLQSFWGSLADSIPSDHKLYVAVFMVCSIFFLRPVVSFLRSLGVFAKTHISLGSYLDRYLGVKVVMVENIGGRSQNLNELDQNVGTATHLLEDASRLLHSVPQIINPESSDTWLGRYYQSAVDAGTQAINTIRDCHLICTISRDEKDLTTSSLALNAATCAHRTAEFCFAAAEFAWEALSEPEEIITQHPSSERQQESPFRVQQESPFEVQQESPFEVQQEPQAANGFITYVLDFIRYSFGQT